MAVSKVPSERQNFRKLIIGNPNYFGNLKAVEFKPVKTILSDTSFEEVKCVGFNPQLNRLEAVVWVKQNSGYGGGICSSGTPEWVRFYLSFDNGATWLDQGAVNFTAYDVSGDKPLEFDVTLEITPSMDFCWVENLPKVRAILSWDYQPPPNTPNFTPVWGNVLDAFIQIAPLQLIAISKVFEEAKFKIPEKLKSVLDLNQPLNAIKPKALSVTELNTLYKNSKVPGHRFLFPEIQKSQYASAVQSPTLPMPPPKSNFSLAQIPGIDLAAVLAQLLATEGNTSFEQLNCIGLDPNRGALAGILKVKLKQGYEGGLCTAGSQEYVAFWVDWGDGAGWTYAGTASVNVHDITSNPTDGLNYAAFLSIDVASHLRPCEQGPKTAKVRAILSWETPPPPGNPDYVPTWGNRLETLILLPPGSWNYATPNIWGIGGIGLAGIDIFGGGMTIAGSPQAKFVLTGDPADPYAGRACPFGGQVVIQGYPSVGLKYRVWARKVSDPLHPVILNDSIWIVNNSGVGTNSYADPSGFFEYVDVGNNVDQVLAYFIPGGDDLWEIRLEIYNAAETVFMGSTPWYRVQMDNTLPNVDIHIDSGGDCKDFTVATTIDGHFVAQDANFGIWSLSTEPYAAPPGALTETPPPATDLDPTPPSPGGIWTLVTTAMAPCGYVVRLDAWDRAIVDSSPGLHNYNYATVGFCLRA